jgi:hypothetical protein
MNSVSEPFVILSAAKDLMAIASGMRSFATLRMTDELNMV